MGKVTSDRGDGLELVDDCECRTLWVGKLTSALADGLGPVDCDCCLLLVVLLTSGRGDGLRAVGDSPCFLLKVVEADLRGSPDVCELEILSERTDGVLCSVDVESGRSVCLGAGCVWDPRSGTPGTVVRSCGRAAEVEDTDA